MSHKSIQLAAAIVNRGAGNRAASIFHTYNHEILLAVRGHGTASSAVMDCLGLDEPEKDLVLGLSNKSDADIPMTNSHSYELIASVIHTDLSAPVMEAARKAGCQGGTLIKAREIGTDAGKKLFGMTLSQEKAILLIMTPADLRLPILKAICETVMKETGEHAVAISLPVDAVEGLAG